MSKEESISVLSSDSMIFLPFTFYKAQDRMVLVYDFNLKAFTGAPRTSNIVVSHLLLLTWGNFFVIR